MSKHGGDPDSGAAVPHSLSEQPAATVGATLEPSATPALEAPLKPPIMPSGELAFGTGDSTYDDINDTQQDTRELVTMADPVIPDGFSLPLPAPPTTVETDGDDSARAPQHQNRHRTPSRSQQQLADGVVTEAAPELLSGARIGRYVVLEELGAGGMGQVYAAYDPKLDRKVAIKLLLPNRGKKPRSSKARSRMAREARALAKLSHPNVVTVYDADEHADGVFIAMELVEGQSLATWSQSIPRPSWREVLKHYLQAARGLSAAHEVGLIHRDFKPDNVLVGDDGRVRVADFGIAALVEQDSDSLERSSDLNIEVPSAESLSSIERLVTDNLTKTGAALGTPAYMAPEQHVGGDIGPATDQYALCAALYEGLFRVRPFSSTSKDQLLPVLLRKKRELDIEPPAPGTGVPDWVRKVLLRGLAPNPDERWPSVDKLIATLEKALSSRRYTTGRHATRERRWGIAIGAAAGILILGGVGLFAMGWLRGDEEQGACARAHREINRVWNAKSAARVQAAFIASGRAHAQASYERVAGILGNYAEKWTTMRVAACEATHVREQQSEQVLALRMHCLDRRKNRLDALVEALAEPDALSQPADDGAAAPLAGTSTSENDALGQAIEAALTLPAIAECADVDRLNAAIPLPEDPALRQRVRTLLDRVDRAAVLRRAGLYAEARDIARDVLAQSADIDYPPLRARSLFESAAADMRLNEAEAAETAFRELLPVAAAAKDDALIARTWGKIIEVVGIQQGRPKDAMEWVPVATAMIERAGDELVGTQVWTSVSHVLRAAGKYQEALERDRASLAIRERLRPKKHFDVAEALHNVGESLWYLGKYQEARDYHERALAIWLDTVGEDHPRTAATLSNLGTISNSLGDPETSLTYHKRSLKVAERLFGPDHPSITTNLNNIGVGEYSRGNPRAGLKYLKRSLAIRERTFPENHPHIAIVCANIAVSLQAAGHYRKSLEYFQRALAIQEQALGENHPTTAWSHRNMGGLLSMMGRYDEARTHLDQAMSMFVAALGEDHEHVATTLHEIGDLLGERGQYKQALDSHRRALDVHRKTHGESHTLVARSLNHLGQTLWRMGDYEQARKRYQEALAMHEQTVGNEHFNFGYTASNLGILLADMGEYEEAERHFQKALAIGKKWGLRNQSSIAHATHYRGLLQYEVGKYRAAEKTLSRAASMRVDQLGEDHPDTATSWDQLAQVLRERGDSTRASKLHARARAVREDKFGMEHRAVADSLDGQGALAGDDGRWREALKAHERALAIRDRQQGVKHPDVARSLAGVARAELALGRTSDARAHYQRSLVIRERVFGPQHPRVADSLIGLTDVALADGEERQARRLARRALSICEGIGHRCQARARFALLRADSTSKRARRKARKSAERIKNSVGKAGNRRLEDAIEHWLDR